MQRGKLIVIDGADSTGKATQTKLLQERFIGEGLRVGTLDFPQYTNNVFGKLIKECLIGEHGDFISLDPKIASTLYAADRFESKGVLEKILEENDLVILDRYVSANMLHQGAKIVDTREREEFLTWLEHVEYEIFNVPKPDLTISLMVSVAHSTALFHKMVREGSKAFDVAEKDRLHQQMVSQCVEWLSSMKDDWVEVHCSDKDDIRSREDIHEEIYGIVKRVL